VQKVPLLRCAYKEVSGYVLLNESIAVTRKFCQSCCLSLDHRTDWCVLLLCGQRQEDVSCLGRLYNVALANF